MLNLGNVFILGDSYSTFEGYNPEGYAFYYPQSDREGYPELANVEATWWYQLEKETDSKIIMNNSWSGSTICHTGYDGADCAHNSFAARIDKLIEEKFFEDNKIDTFIILGGTNDSWADSPLGEIKYSDWTKEDLYCVFPAFCYLVEKIKTKCNCKRILCVINDGLKEEITDTLRLVSEKNNIEALNLKDIDKVGGHPTVKGMTQIKDQIKEALC